MAFALVASALSTIMQRPHISFNRKVSLRCKDETKFGVKHLPTFCQSGGDQKKSEEGDDHLGVHSEASNVFLGCGPEKQDACSPEKGCA